MQLDDLEKVKRRIRLLQLLDAAERAGIAPIELSKLHATGEWQKTLTANGLGPDADAPLKSPVQHCGGG